VLLVGDGPDGLALMRFRPSLWSDGLECYLGELYVVPALRGQGRGRALMDAALAFARERGADHIELNTDEGDHAAHALYESVGLKPTATYYEREL
jgi:GNAT superfamily N-acetyltransferase